MSYSYVQVVACNSVYVTSLRIVYLFIKVATSEPLMMKSESRIRIFSIDIFIPKYLLLIPNSNILKVIHLCTYVHTYIPTLECIGLA